MQLAGRASKRHPIPFGGEYFEKFNPIFGLVVAQVLLCIPMPSFLLLLRLLLFQLQQKPIKDGRWYLLSWPSHICHPLVGLAAAPLLVVSKKWQESFYFYSRKCRRMHQCPASSVLWLENVTKLPKKSTILRMAVAMTGKTSLRPLLWHYNTGRRARRVAAWWLPVWQKQALSS